MPAKPKLPARAQADPRRPRGQVAAAQAPEAQKEKAEATPEAAPPPTQAPLALGEGAYVAAGSTVNRDVPSDALAIARGRQVNKREYRQKLEARFKRRRQVEASGDEAK